MQRTGNKQVFLVLLGIFIVGLLSLDAWYLHENFTKVQSQTQAVQKSTKVLLTLDNILIEAINIETGARGFLVTNNEKYLAPYQAGSASIWVEIEKLRSLTSMNSSHSSTIDAAEKIIVKQFEVLEDSITNESEDKVLIAQKLDQSKIYMDTLRGYVDEM